MKTIYKYILPNIGIKETIDIYENYEIIHFEMQNEIPCFWAMVNTENQLVKKDFLIIGTGQGVPERGWYVKTCSQEISTLHTSYGSHSMYTGTKSPGGIGKLMWHLFEIL